MQTKSHQSKIPSSSHETAVLSHYHHLTGSEFSRTYEPEARRILQQMAQATKEEGKNTLGEPTIEYNLFPEFFSVPFRPNAHTHFTFIDLFAGIGGFRMAMQNLGGRCVFSSEWDVQAQQTYFANYGEMPFGDITKEETKAYIPDNFDVLCAGFPCQAFSLAGKRLGFEETRGTLFFDVAEIIRRKRPKAFFLENVKGLMIHDKGKTMQTILKVLREDFDYFVPEPQIVNAMHFGVPQHRERVYIVGFKKTKTSVIFTTLLPPIAPKFLEISRRKTKFQPNTTSPPNIWPHLLPTASDTLLKATDLAMKSSKTTKWLTQ